MVTCIRTKTLLILVVMLFLQSGDLARVCANNFLMTTGVSGNDTPKIINPTAKDVVRMEIEWNALIGEIRINDIPVYYKPGCDDLSVASSCSEWLKNGVNTIEIAGHWPDGIPYEPHEAKASVMIIHASTKSLFHDTSDTCLFLNWMSEKANESVHESGRITFSGLPEISLWNKTEAIKEISDSDRKSMIDCLNELAQAFNTGDSIKLEQLLDLSFTESLRLSTTPEADREFFMGIMSTAYEFPDWRIQSVEEQPLNFRIVGNGHLVWVTGKDHSPVIKTVDGDFPFALQVYFGKINGKWCILR